MVIVSPIDLQLVNLVIKCYEPFITFINVYLRVFESLIATELVFGQVGNMVLKTREYNDIRQLKIFLLHILKGNFSDINTDNV